MKMDEQEWINKGRKFFIACNLSEAIKCFDEALQINSLNDFTWFYKANALLELRDYEEAIKCYDEAIKIYPKDEFRWNNRLVCNNDKWQKINHD